MCVCQKPRITASFSSCFFFFSTTKLYLCPCLSSRHTPIMFSPKLFLCGFTPIYLKSNSKSSIHVNLGINFSPLLLDCLPVTYLLSFHHTFLLHGEAIPIYVIYLRLQYLDIYIFYKFLDLFLISSKHCNMLAHIFFAGFKK
jgi:hypothetical protein